nr:hypothetical protein [Candidatus Njordarchaeota archaeon]
MLSEPIVNYGPPRTYEGSGKTVHKVVVIQVRSTDRWEVRRLEDHREFGENVERDSDGYVEGVLGARVVQIKEGQVVFWVLSTSVRNVLGFEVSYLQGAVAAVVVLESSDRETIHNATELLRAICKLFSIPVMLVVGGSVSKGAISLGSTHEFASLASKVVSFAQIGRAAIRAS